MTPSTYPAWAEDLRRKYLSGEASVFILHGNVFDRFWVNDLCMDVQTFLAQDVLTKDSRQVLELSLAQGLRALSNSSSENLPNGISESVVYLSELLGNPKKPKTAVLVPYASTLLPQTETSMLNIDERILATAMHRWSLDQNVEKSDHLVVLITEFLTDLNASLVSNPRVAIIEVPLPSEEERATTIRKVTQGMSASHQSQLAHHTAGLRGVQIAGIVGGAQGDKGLSLEQRQELIKNALLSQNSSIAETDLSERVARLSQITGGMSKSDILATVGGHTQDDLPDEEMLALIRRRKRKIIEKECEGLIEFLDPKHGLEAVGGNEHIKTELMSIAQVFKSGDTTLSPMGLLAVGPMGAGKTFVIKAFLKEAGLPAVMLKNFRSKWNGVTESNLERVLSTVKAMGPVALVMDEGDRSFGSASADTDGSTSSRVMARLKDFMSDTENRGRVLFIVMTNRPDRIETDLKRPERLDKKIPFFYADNPLELSKILLALWGRNKTFVDISEASLLDLCAPLVGYSNADLEALALLTMEYAHRTNGDSTVNSHLFAEAVADFIPPREEAMVGLMEMLAVQETSRRSLLPEKYQKMPSGEIREKIRAYRLEVGRE